MDSNVDSGIMVLTGYRDIVDPYDEIRASAADAGGCSVLILLPADTDALATCRVLTVRFLH